MAVYMIATAIVSPLRRFKIQYGPRQRFTRKKFGTKHLEHFLLFRRRTILTTPNKYFPALGIREKAHFKFDYVTLTKANFDCAQTHEIACFGTIFLKNCMSLVNQLSQ